MKTNMNQIGNGAAQLNDTKEVVWFLEMTQERICERIQECENEIVRNERFKDVPAAIPYNFPEATSRQRAIDSSNKSLEFLRRADAFCRAAIEFGKNKSAEEFAKAFAGSFKR